MFLFVFSIEVTQKKDLYFKVRQALAWLYINYQLDALIIIYS